jgi:hypothetical protein
MNTIQDNFSCPTTVLLNYGGYDSGSSSPEIFDTTGRDLGQYRSGTGFPYNTNGTICKDSQNNLVTTFPSQLTGDAASLTQSAVTSDAKYRAIQTAANMRMESTPIYIFTIALGSGVSSSTQAFLAQLANDPSYSTYIKGQPAGLFFYIPNCPSTTCTTAVQQAFQTIAAKVMLRLTE